MQEATAPDEEAQPALNEEQGAEGGAGMTTEEQAEEQAEDEPEEQEEGAEELHPRKRLRTDPIGAPPALTAFATSGSAAPSPTAVGLALTGSVTGTFDLGYTCTLQIADQVFRGVLYCPEGLVGAQAAQQPAARPSHVPFPKVPKRNKTAFNFYSMEVRPKAKEQNPTADQKEVSRIVGEWWTNLSSSEKEPYQQQAREDKERYEAEVREYQAALTAPAPVVAVTPTGGFAQARSARLAAAAAAAAAASAAAASPQQQQPPHHLLKQPSVQRQLLQRELDMQRQQQQAAEEGRLPMEPLNPFRVQAGQGAGSLQDVLGMSLRSEATGSLGPQFSMQQQQPHLGAATYPPGASGSNPALHQLAQRLAAVLFARQGTPAASPRTAAAWPGLQQQQADPELLQQTGSAFQAFQARPPSRPMLQAASENPGGSLPQLQSLLQALQASQPAPAQQALASNTTPTQQPSLGQGRSGVELLTQLLRARQASTRQPSPPEHSEGPQQP